MSSKGNTNVIIVEYVVQDCPIMGRIVIKHYINCLEYGKA